MKSRHFSICLLALVCSVSLGQVPTTTFYWEASDGGAWTRQLLNTTSSTVHCRVVAEWGGVAGGAFGASLYDAVVTTAFAGDVAANPTRLGRFILNPQLIAVTRMGNLIKIDDSRDSAAPGAGNYGIDSTQSNGEFGEPVDHSNPAILFSFDLNLSTAPGMRQVSSLHKVFDAAGNNVFLWGPTGSSRAIATVQSVSVMYVPSAPGILTLGLSGTACLRRRRASKI